MAITTLDGAISGFQFPRFIAKSVTGTMVVGRPFSFWGTPGSPGAGAFDNTLNGVVLSSTSANVAGQIPWTDPVSGNAYLAQATFGTTTAGGIIIADRLWHNGGFTITSTSAQNITSPTFPARDIAGSTNGDGVLLAVEVSAAVGAGTPTITIAYTNQAGTAGRTATNVLPTVASPVAGSVYLIGLQAGDTGVRSIQSLTLSATWTSGTINLVAYRPLLVVNSLSVGLSGIDTVTGGLPRMFNGSVPYLMFYPTATTSTGLTGSVVFTQG